MWKKIHSNRDPRDTLFSELQKEFKPYFLAGGSRITRLLGKKPRWTFGIMITALSLSAALSFTVFRRSEPSSKPRAATDNGLRNGFDQIIGTAQKLNNTIRLKRTIDSISAKPRLNAADSSALNQALDSLSSLQRSLKLQDHEH